jgi:hypothetical protein
MNKETKPQAENVTELPRAEQTQKQKQPTPEQQALYNLVQLAGVAVNGYAEIISRKLND